MKVSKKILSLLLALLMLCSLTLPSLATEEETATLISAPLSITEDYTGKTVILHTNDTHGAIEGYAKLASLRDEFVAAGAEVILMDAGDFIQGSTAVSISQGANAVALMNAVGYDYVTLGNHEFDYGYASLMEVLAKAEFNITSNVYYNDEPVFAESYTFETAGGLTVGLFGLETPETATKTHPAKIQGVSFLAEEELYAHANAMVDKLDDTCDVIICLAHLGVDPSSAPNNIYDLWKNTTGIDFIIDGHSHTVMEAGDNGEPIQSTGTKFENVGVIVLGEEGIEDNFLFSLDEYTLTDGEIRSQAEAFLADVDAQYGTPFATSEVAFSSARAPGVRTQETLLGNLVADAIFWQATKDGGLSVDLDHVVAITNGGGLRADLNVGDITKNDVLAVLPYGNTVAFVTVSGSVLLEVLEASTFCTPESVGAFPQVAGIEFTVDTTKTYDAGDLYPGSTYAGPNSINRVTINSINGKPFNVNDTYLVVTNDFLAAGGDTYYAFSVSEAVDTGIPMDEALMAYIAEVLGGNIPAAEYGQTEGRTTILTAADMETYVVVAGDTLWGIATRLLGGGAKWKDLYEANKAIIENPNLIYIGQELVIPG